MAEITYTGNADFRTLTKSDWESIGVDDQEDAVWLGSGSTVTMSDAAADKLLELMPDEFATAAEMEAVEEDSDG